MENLRSLHTENLSNEILLSVLDEIKGLREDLKGLGDKPIKRALDVKDLKEMLKVSSTTAIKIMKSEGFPLIGGVGTRLLVYENDFYEWEKSKRRKELKNE